MTTQIQEALTDAVATTPATTAPTVRITKARKSKIHALQITSAVGAVMPRIADHLADNALYCMFTIADIVLTDFDSNPSYTQMMEAPALAEQYELHVRSRDDKRDSDDDDRKALTGKSYEFLVTLTEQFFNTNESIAALGELGFQPTIDKKQSYNRLAANANKRRAAYEKPVRIVPPQATKTKLSF